jgi:hypothetical protein
MAKIVFENRAAPTLRTATRTFPDPDHPDAEPLTLTIGEPSVLTQAAIQEAANRLIERWVPGPGRTVTLHPAVATATGLPRAYLSATMVSALAVLEAIQIAPPEERYGFDELLSLAVRCPRLWRDVSDWANELVSGDFDPGNSSVTEAAGSSSPPPSVSTSSTPPSSSSETPASEASTPDSVTSAELPPAT